ncbi:DUF3429 domain-containing protein [Caldimonas thermodepolymerans]|jgi:hypothetical protein|uniref:DUF3429 domain-containing protein n=1 Tax=Caldimonas thermodepolymerans TaxID=215580 RepID=A0A2S5T8H0_9BURK|nr:DUF3429 domain-containing protein [Caldimonas thermodepolymerans]PPE71259.1 DUF3429 domain-containing protein [Caldimonas thermodepolymerans]QPC32433.1 DUF3429 domain-containing protein [Caldimonas thermodepolymerans]RDH98820.1 uncharacterized protein DUF3429 [Caldimonas thermodepolymerans]
MSRPGSSLPPPPVARWLVHLGLLPFVSGALLVWLVHPEVQPHVTLALAGHAAVVLSFLGGVQWGLAVRQPVPSPVPCTWGVVLAGVAWVAVVMPPYAGLVVLGAMQLLACLVDRRLYPGLGARGWLVLRFRLAAVASLSCFLAAAGV